MTVPRLSLRTAFLFLSWVLLLCNALRMSSSSSSSSNKGKELAAARRRRDARRGEGSDASRWSDMQKGRRQDYATLKSRGYSKDLALQEEIANELRKMGQIDSESIAEAVGAMPVVCPFDTQINCGPNKICPTDGRPCPSSRHYFFPSASSDTLPPTILNAFSDSVGRLMGPPDFPESAFTGDEGELLPPTLEERQRLETEGADAADLSGGAADEHAWTRALRWISGLFGRREDEEKL